MKKMPILRPAVEAVLFGFERIGMAIRIAWLPIVLVIAMYGAAIYAMIGPALIDGISADNPEDALEGIFTSPQFLILWNVGGMALGITASLIMSCIYVALTRAAALADYEPPRLPFYFAFGGREIRYFLTRIVYALIIIAAAVALSGVGAIIIMIAAAGVDGASPAANAAILAPAFAICIVLVIIFLWVVVRFLPALAIAAVENRIDFGGAWKMSKGNFLRIALSGAMFAAMLQALVFVILIAVLLPPGVVLGLLAAFGYAFAGPPSFAIIGLIVLAFIPGMILLTAFAAAAEAAFPARLYAYLSDCGEACKI